MALCPESMDVLPASCLAHRRLIFSCRRWCELCHDEAFLHFWDMVMYVLCLKVGFVNTLNASTHTKLLKNIICITPCPRTSLSKALYKYYLFNVTCIWFMHFSIDVAVLSHYINLVYQRKISGSYRNSTQSST